MELMESRTGSFTPATGWYEKQIKWIDSWPSAIHENVRNLSNTSVMDFMLKAISQPMRS
jgi:hypothetical protein